MQRRLTMAVLVALAAGLAGPVAGQVPSAAQLQNPELETKKLKPGANSFAESQARQLLQDSGYADVSPLVNDKDGIWHGTATKDQKQVEVSVDYQGRIAAK